ncbi:MAG: LysM peptidoglycan-binding domain-containing protein [Desulfobacteraceae bacterium]|nr:LysM peptidoglycan-binding domain-containing protein [Desulfobacteraceae bacterium]
MLKKLILFLIVIFHAPAYGTENGTVKIPLAFWEQLQSEIESAGQADKPTLKFSTVKRSVSGEFRKGLFKGNLVTEIKVSDTGGHIRIPLLDSAASLGKVVVNGQTTSLLRRGRMYTFGVDKPGIYTVDTEFFLGREQDRFERKLRFNLPEAGVTKISVLVPEKDIETKLQNGALESEKKTDNGTLLQGFLDATGIFDLSWTRKVTHKAAETARTEVRLNTLFTVREAMVSGLSVFDINVLEGETDRIDISLPKQIEVVSVEGDAVLQWRISTGRENRLAVLLRYLIKDHTQVKVNFQFPVDEGKTIKIRMPSPARSKLLSGAMGIQGPAGLDIKLEQLKKAKKLELRDLPPDLTNLTPNPLLYAFSFDSIPGIGLSVRRHKELHMISTLIDDVQASTVIIEDGTEITKIKMRIRNNSRQYLRMQLNENAKLTHSLIDGRPVRPAIVTENNREVLLFPLQQSEKVGKSGMRHHTVKIGETLSDIANFFYTDPNMWMYILDNNRDQLYSASGLRVGQRLRIPVKRGVQIEESSFLVELAYKITDTSQPGLTGIRKMQLPKTDVDIMKITWHIYLPKAFQVLSFNSNLTQYSDIRYDPFRRLYNFLRQALWREAWAGGKWSGKTYQNILEQRKKIYKADYATRTGSKAVLAYFPLVGKQYRFKRELPGKDAPFVSAAYVPAWFKKPARWIAFLIVFAVCFRLLSGPGRNELIIAGIALVGLLFAAHYFQGIHKKIIWGADAALIVSVIRMNWLRWKAGLTELVLSPWTVLNIFTFFNLIILVSLCIILWGIMLCPMLLSVTVMFILFFYWRHKSLKLETGLESFK